MKKSIIIIFLSSFWLFSQSFSTDSQIIPIADAGDINNNGIPDFLAFNKGDFPRTVTLYEIDDRGVSVAWKYTLSPAKDGYFIDAVIGDFDGDGSVEIVIVSSLENSTDMFYVFKLIGSGFGPVPQIIAKFPSALTSPLRPIKAQSINWDEDGDEELFIVFSSPERCGYICDYENNEILIIDKIAEEFLADTYSPIWSAVGDFNNDQKDDVVLFNNGDTTKGKVFLTGLDNEYLLDLPTGKLSFLPSNFVDKLSFTISDSLLYNLEFKDSLFVVEPSNKSCSADLSEVVSSLFFAEEISNVQSIHLEQFGMLLVTHGGDNPEIALFEIADIKLTEENESVQLDIFEIDFVVEHDSLFEYNIQLKDSIEFLSLETNSLPSGMRFDSDDFVLSWVPNKKQLGFRKIIYKTVYRSPGNLKESVEGKIHKAVITEKIISEIDSFIVYVNSPPKFSDTHKEFSVVSGDTLNFKFNVSDLNDDAELNFYLLGDSSSYVELFDGGEVQIKPQNNTAETSSFNLIVNDGFASDTVSFGVTVHPNIVFEAGDTVFNINVGEEFETIVEVDSSSLISSPVFMLENAPENMRISGSGVINWIPTSTQIDTQKFVVSVSNKYTQSSTEMATFVNALPIISSRPAESTAIPVNQEWVFPLGSFDANSNATLTWHLIDAPPGMSIDSLGILKFTPDSLGWFGYSLELDDDNSTAGFSGKLYVNSPPIINGTPTEFAVCGEEYSYFLNVLDSNVTSFQGKGFSNNLQYELYNYPDGMVIDTNGVILWTPTETQFGNFSFSVSVTDGVATNEQDITIFVNSPPTIVSADSIRVRIGQEINHKIQVKDLNKNDTINYSISQSLVGVEFDTTNGVLKWSPSVDHFGYNQLDVSVADGHSGGQTQQNIKIFVFDFPKILNIPPKEAFVGLQYKFRPNIIDFFEETNVSFEILNNTSDKIVLDSTNSFIEWSPDSSELGIQSYSIRAVDRFGLITTENYSINVLANPCEKCDDENAIEPQIIKDTNLTPTSLDSLEILDTHTNEKGYLK